MIQADTSETSLEHIMRTPSFKAGVDDVRTGRSERFDLYRGFEYERGRQWAKLAPPTMPFALVVGSIRTRLRYFEKCSSVEIFCHDKK